MILPHGGVLQVQLRQQLIAAPGLVPQAVVIAVVAVKAHPVPVAVGGVLPVPQQVPEGEEVPAGMVEHRVQHHPQALFVAVGHKVAQVVVGPQAGIQQAIVGGLVAVTHGLEQRPDVQGVQAQAGDVIHPGQERPQPGLRFAVIVLRRRAAQAQGIDVIKGCAFIPVHRDSSLL